MRSVPDPLAEIEALTAEVKALLIEVRKEREALFHIVLSGEDRSTLERVLAYLEAREAKRLEGQVH